MANPNPHSTVTIPAPVVEQPDEIAKVETYIKVLHIYPQLNAKWEAERTQQLMISLFSINAPFKLAIHATASGIHWLAEVPGPYAAAMTKSLYATSPRAQIDVRFKHRTLLGFYAYHFHAAAPFIGPLQYVEAFPKLDPLAMLLSAMTDLAEDEELVYELELHPIEPEHVKIGRKLAKQSLTDWWDLLTFEGAEFAAIRKARGVDEVDKYVPSLQRLVDTKLDNPLKRASLAMKINAKSERRALDILALQLPALALFERTSCNFLVPAQEKSSPLVLCPAEAAALWHLPSEQCQVRGIVWAPSASAPAPVLATDDKNFIRLGVNRYQGREQPVKLAYEDRVTHVNLLGQTGAGKSTLLHSMAHQDIAAGKGVAVIDPHGDLIDHIVATSIPREREADVILFDVSDADYPIGLNFFAAPDNLDPAAVAGMTLAVIRKMFAESWSSTRMEDALYAALLALQTVDGATIRDVARLFHDSSFRSQLLMGVKDPVVLEFWYEEFEPLSASYQSEFARPITNRLRKFYRNPQIGRIIGQTTSLDFPELMNAGKIFLAKLTGIPEIEAETLGALLISKFQLAAMSRTRQAPESRRPYYLYIDEVQNMSTTSLDVLFSEARKTELNLVVANQFLRQLERATLDAILGNAGTTIIFRVGPKDATTLAAFVRPQFTNDDLVNLDRFNAIVKMQLDAKTQPAFSLQTPTPLTLPPDANERFERIRDLSRERYARPKEVVDAELIEKYQQYQQQNRPGAGDAVEETYFG